MKPNSFWGFLKAARPLLVTALSLLAVAAPARATFPGTNGKLAFYSNRPTGNGIYVMQPDGSGETFVAEGRQPAWSPDGTMIAFVRGNDIWVMNAQGGGQLQLTSNGSGQFPFDTEPAWTQFHRLRPSLATHAQKARRRPVCRSCPPTGSAPLPTASMDRRSPPPRAPAPSRVRPV